LLAPAMRNFFLLLASYFFYYSYEPLFVLLLLATSCIDFWCAKKIDTCEHKKFYLWLSIGCNLGVLAAFKYSAFFYNTFFGGFQMLTNNQFNPVEDLIIPAGLSFYTFQSMSYTIDVYRKKYRPTDTLYDFLLYVSFFPHMVAGPVVRYSSLMPQLKALKFFKEIDWGTAGKLIIWGYFKKLVVADNLGLVVSPVFDQVGAYSGAEIFIASAMFVLQVYCDFSGYSDIATGVAKLFKIDLSLNWRRPLFSRSLHEFWGRNHISITTWFRDYLYISLGGNRVKYKRWLLNIFLVFVISGFWHGANLTFIIWGVMHGAFYIGEIFLRKGFPEIRVPSWIGRIYLLFFHILSLAAFRALDVYDLRVIYKKIFWFGESYFSLSGLLQLHDRFFYGVMVAVFFTWLFKEIEEEYRITERKKTWGLLRSCAYIIFVTMIFILGNFSANTFIYFRF
jgi:alginate O-acetyltransferase complex protein AlgI